MSGNLNSRIRKAEQSFTIHANLKNYIDAMKRSLLGQDNGESLNALPSLDEPGAPINRTELYVIAISNLEAQAKLDGRELKLKADFDIEAFRRLAANECQIGGV